MSVSSDIAHTEDKVENAAKPVGYLCWASSCTSKLGLDTCDWDILITSLCIKLLLFPSYRSTDFEVHRNWLAITSSLPITRWYFDQTSEWTLDYPPFFAFFEKLLSVPAAFIDRSIVDLQNLKYDAWTVISYQRSTVILSELLLGLVLLRFIRGSVDPSAQRIISASVFLHPGFLIVDHVHFQYNGFLFGILLWSLLMARNGNKLSCGIFFAALLNFKHIYLYLAPAYFVYLLHSFCISPTGQLQMNNFALLASSVVTVFAVSFGPFLLTGQISQVFSRLFPFTRGLNHAYWAANAWALVTAADRLLLKYIQLTNADISVNTSGTVSSSRGLVGDTNFAVLPNVKPIHTFLITIAFQSMWLIKLWLNPTYKSFLTAVTLCGYTSFLFGWHVHEKAVLLVLIPLSFLAAERQAYFRTFILTSIAGIFALFPLLFTPGESIVKVLYSVIWVLLVYGSLNRRVYEFPRSLIYVIIDLFEKVYLAGFLILLAFVGTFPFLGQREGHPVGNACPGSDKCNNEKLNNAKPLGTLEFLPLMLTSVYCAIGLVWGFLRLMFIYLHEEANYQSQLSNIK